MSGGGVAADPAARSTSHRRRYVRRATPAARLRRQLRQDQLDGPSDRLLHPVQPTGAQPRDIDLGSGGASCCRTSRGPSARGDRSGQGRHDLPRRPRQHGPLQRTNNDNQIVQSLTNIFPNGTAREPGNFSAPVYYNGSVYFAPVNSLDAVLADERPALDVADVEVAGDLQRQDLAFSPAAARSRSRRTAAPTGSSGRLQSNGDSQPGTLHAYDPSNLANEYYTSDQAGRARPTRSVAEVHDPDRGERTSLRRLGRPADRLRSAAVERCSPRTSALEPRWFLVAPRRWRARLERAAGDGSTHAHIR